MSEGNEAKEPKKKRAKGGRGSNLDGVRRRNLSLVLRLVHAAGSMTRAELARETGLNRSTIAAIVTELERLDVVRESIPDVASGAHSVGRPSFVIVPTRTTIAVAINPEVDAITIGLVALTGEVLRSVRFENVETPTPIEVVNAVRALLSSMSPELRGSNRTVGIGLAIPGLVRAGDGAVSVAPHLGWHDVPFAAMIEEATGLPTVASNDAACGVLAEHLYGAGRGVDNLVYLNGGASGIGGGVILDGSRAGGTNGFAGEIGHTLVNSAGSLCHCGATGCLETEITRAELLDALGLGADRVDELEALLIDRYAEGGEIAAIVDRQADFLIVALRNVVNLFNPELVILGGFLGSLYRVAGERIRSAVEGSALPGARNGIEIVSATLGRSNLLMGAAELAFADLLDDPASVNEILQRGERTALHS